MSDKSKKYCRKHREFIRKIDATHKNFVESMKGTRLCLKCGDRFESKSVENRICNPCREAVRGLRGSIGL